jgi:hypothetical protein
VTVYYDANGNQVDQRPQTLFRILMGLCVMAFVFFFVLMNWSALRPKFAGPLTLFATATPGAISTAATPTQAIIIPTSRPPLRDFSGAPISAGAGLTISAATPTAAPSATPLPCVLTTWPNGSQSCSDGRHIDAAHSQAGYCTPVVWGDGSVSCNDGKPSGNVVWADPEVQAEPTNTPWPAAPSDGVQWTASDGPNGNTCVTVGAQTACSDPGVKLDADDAAFVARLIEDGKIEQGAGTPKG